MSKILWRVCVLCLLSVMGTAQAQSVVISELMYEPPGGSAFAEAEFLELLNPGSVPVDLSGATFTA